MHLSPSTSATRHIPSTAPLDAVASVWHHGGETFNVMTSGDRACELLLFPENGIRLEQDLPVDATQYEREFHRIHPEEQLAIRRWTATDADEGKFSDVELPLRRQGIPGMNVDLNQKLAVGSYLNEEEQDMCEKLSSALRQLPPLCGEYLRVAEYTRQYAVPWGNTIRVGDTVTNFPCFMSVSEDAEYAADTARGSVLSDESEVLAFYKIEKATTAVPLWRGIASLTHEQEWLFPRASCFIVNGISTARPTIERDGCPILRVGILLEQVAVETSAKNLYTGYPVDINTQRACHV